MAYDKGYSSRRKLSCGCFSVYFSLLLLVGGCAAILLLLGRQAYRSYMASPEEHHCIVTETSGESDICLKHGWNIVKPDGETFCMQMQFKCIHSVESGQKQNSTTKRGTLIGAFMDIFDNECRPCSEQQSKMTMERYMELTSGEAVRTTFLAYIDESHHEYASLQINDQSNFWKWYLDSPAALTILILPSVAIFLAIFIPIFICCCFRIRDCCHNRKLKPPHIQSDIEYKRTGFEHNFYPDQDGARISLLMAASSHGNRSPPPLFGEHDAKAAQQHPNHYPTLPASIGKYNRQPSIIDPEGPRRSSQGDVIDGKKPLQLAPLAVSSAATSDITPSTSTPSSHSPNSSDSIPLTQYDRFRLRQSGVYASLPRGSQLGPSSPNSPNYRQLQFNRREVLRSPSYISESGQNGSKSEQAKPGKLFQLKVNSDGTVEK